MTAEETGLPEVRIRSIPWPYAAVFALCSDLDETPDAKAYFEIARFLNTREPTSMGDGVGLEVGNTLFFDMPAGQFSYWGTDEGGRERARALVRSGHIDAVHSWGDLALRAQAERNLAELERHGLRFEVWIDHSQAPTNLGPDLMRGRGDLPGDPAYHADLTLAHGIRYVWRGRTTGITGQDVPIRPGSFAPMLQGGRALASARSAAKEAVKIGLGRLGSPRWSLYGANRTCTPCTLRDGQRAWEFLRTNPSWGGPGESATADGLAEVLTPKMLDRLAKGGGMAILYTHLGKVRDPARPFGAETVKALRELARRAAEGEIFVTTTQRLLRYRTVRDALRFTPSVEGSRRVITIEAVDDPVTGSRPPAPGDLDGLTFGMRGAGPIEVRLADGTPLQGEAVAEGAGTSWVSLPWPRLRFPKL